jgi:hypothetical protein
MVLNWLFDNLLSIQFFDFDIDIDNLFDPQKNSTKETPTWWLLRKNSNNQLTLVMTPMGIQWHGSIKHSSIAEWILFLPSFVSCLLCMVAGALLPQLYQSLKPRCLYYHFTVYNICTSTKSQLTFNRLLSKFWYMIWSWSWKLALY